MTAETPKMAVVPVIATDEMMLAGITAGNAQAFDVDERIGWVQTRAIFDAMLAAAPEALANRDPQGGEAWRPIETAPKTDEANMVALPFLGWCPEPEADGGGDQRICWWEPKTDGGSWWSDRDLPEHPTLWAPLPASPHDDRLANTKEGEGA